MTRVPFITLKEMYNSYEEPIIVEADDGDVVQRIKILEAVPLCSDELLEEYFNLKYGLSHNTSPEGKFYIVGKLKSGEYTHSEHPKGHVFITLTDIHIEKIGEVRKVYVDIWLCNKNRDNGYVEDPVDLSSILNIEKGEYLFPDIEYKITGPESNKDDKIFELYV